MNSNIGEKMNWEFKSHTKMQNRNNNAQLRYTWYIRIIAAVIVFAAPFRIFGGSHEQPDRKLDPTVILISMDGFRWDYLDRADTPNFDKLVKNGVKAKSLIPILPSKTFPNHYTIVTGLYAENHGIVSNSMYDPEFDARFWIGQGSAPVRESRWWGGEPIWVTVEKQGQVAAAMFWPGSETIIQGVQPSFWYVYDESITNEERVDQVLSWLELPSDERPTLITLYFSDTDNAGHDYGPNSPEVEMTVENLDKLMGRLLSGLEIRGLINMVNIIIVSDHGMAQLSRDRIIFLDDYINVEAATIVDWLPAAIWPNKGKEDELFTALFEAHPKLTVYRKEEIPDRYHYRNNRRIAPIIAIPEVGWSVTTHEYFDSHPDRYTGGTHGYDPINKSMHAIFIASGPAFKKGVSGPSFTNIHIYSLIAEILSLEPAPTDGSIDSVRIYLKE